MTREELINKICLADTTAECPRAESCNKCNVVLNTLLDFYDAQTRSDVIDQAKWIIANIAIIENRKGFTTEEITSVLDQLKN